MYVRSLQIENLQCIERAEMELQYPGREHGAPLLPNVNLLLGCNGVGKTSVLKAISLGVLSQILPSSGFVPYHLVRRDCQQATLTVDLCLHPEDVPSLGAGEAGKHLRSLTAVRTLKGLEEFSRPPEIENRLVWQGLYRESSPAFLLVGYGSTRHVSDFEPMSSQRKRRRLRYLRVARLFEDHLGLPPLVSWLPELAHHDPERFEEVGSLLNELLPLGDRFAGRLESGDYVFEHGGIPVLLGSLSDGHRAYIGWISDLLYNISLGAPKGTRLRDARGVVLVDEIDLHLHPDWQREVVPTVARTLPNLQFVFTTHSPIVAGTLSPKNIFVLEMDGKGASTIRQLEEPIHGLNADQILTSSYFGLSTTRAPAAENQLRELSKKAMTGDSAAAVDFLKKLAAGTKV